MSLSHNRRKTLTRVFFASLVLLFALIGTMLVRLEMDRERQLEIQRVQDILNREAAALQNRLYSNIHRVAGVTALVAMNPDLTQDDFARAMAVMFRGQHDLRNIALARGTVIRFMYPMEGNEAAIGLDYTTQPDQYPAVELAQSLNKIVLAGPVQLVQGGEGIIARIPIHLESTDILPGGFWGFASVVLNNESLFDGIGRTEGGEQVRLAIRGRDASGPDGEVFIGDPSLFENSPLTRTISLPHGSWQMGAIPAGGWGGHSFRFTPLFGVYLLATATVLGFHIAIVFLSRKRHQAVVALEEERSQFAKAWLERAAYELTENIPIGTYTMVQPPEGGMAHFAFMSSRFLKMAGVQREEAAADPLKVFSNIHPDDYDDWLALNIKTIENKSPFAGETRVFVDGKIRWFAAESTPRTLPDGTTVWEGVLTDITERKIATEALLQSNRELEAATARAEAASQAKSDFLANISHEIRTPLNAIIGFSELLADSLPDPTDRNKAQTIATSSHALLHLMNDILDLSKIEAGKLTLLPTSIYIHSFLKEIAELFRLRADQKGIALTSHIAPDVPKMVTLDPVRLRQILLNLIGNALKFTDAGSVHIELGVGTSSAAGSCDLVLSVQDTGIGVDDEFKPHMWRAFEQAAGQDHARYGGTGLGLAISQRLARVMNGDITMEDNPNGQGSVFTLLLRNVEYSEPPPNDSAKKDTSEEDITFLDHPSVLIVENVKSNRDLLRAYLEQSGFPVDAASSGVEALQMMNHQPPGLVLCDLKMPGMDGWSFLERIRASQDERVSRVPVIAITGSPVDTAAYPATPFDAILLKPVSRNALLKAISRFIPHSGGDHISLHHIPENPPKRSIHPDCVDEDLFEQIEPLRRTLRVNQVKEFAQELIVRSQRHGSTDLVQLGEELIQAANDFQIDRIQALLDELRQEK